MALEKEKLELLQNPLVRAIVFDALHKRRDKYSSADNGGTHTEYRVMVNEIEKDYLKQINNLTNNKIN